MLLLTPCQMSLDDGEEDRCMINGDGHENHDLSVSGLVQSPETVNVGDMCRSDALHIPPPRRRTIKTSGPSPPELANTQGPRGPFPHNHFDRATVELHMRTSIGDNPASYRDHCVNYSMGAHSIARQKQQALANCHLPSHLGPARCTVTVHSAP